MRAPGLLRVYPYPGRVDFFQFQSGLMLLVFFGLLLVKGFAFVTALMFSAEAYEAAGQLTKVAWCAILGLGFATQLILPGPLGILNLASPSRRSSTSPTCGPR